MERKSLSNKLIETLSRALSILPRSRRLVLYEAVASYAAHGVKPKLTRNTDIAMWTQIKCLIDRDQGVKGKGKVKDRELIIEYDPTITEKLVTHKNRYRYFDPDRRRWLCHEFMIWPLAYDKLAMQLLDYWDSMGEKDVSWAHFYRTMRRMARAYNDRIGAQNPSY